MEFLGQFGKFSRGSGSEELKLAKTPQRKLPVPAKHRQKELSDEECYAFVSALKFHVEGSDKTDWMLSSKTSNCWFRNTCFFAMQFLTGAQIRQLAFLKVYQVVSDVNTRKVTDQIKIERNRWKRGQNRVEKKEETKEIQLKPQPKPRIITLAPEAQRCIEVWLKYTERTGFKLCGTDWLFFDAQTKKTYSFDGVLEEGKTEARRLNIQTMESLYRMYSTATKMCATGVYKCSPGFRKILLDKVLEASRDASPAQSALVHQTASSSLPQNADSNPILNTPKLKRKRFQNKQKTDSDSDVETEGSESDSDDIEGKRSDSESKPRKKKKAKTEAEQEKTEEDKPEEDKTEEDKPKEDKKPAVNSAQSDPLWKRLMKQNAKQMETKGKKDETKKPRKP